LFKEIFSERYLKERGFKSLAKTMHPLFFAAGRAKGPIPEKASQTKSPLLK
jgi:hypothetical protein